MTTTNESPAHAKFTDRAYRRASVHENKTVTRVHAWAILFDGHEAGRMASYCSPGGTVTATLSIWRGPLERDDVKATFTESAAGYGYDKLSRALTRLLSIYADENADVLDDQPIEYLRSRGYDVIEVI